MTTVHEFEIRDQPISNVVVFKDRAEVKRHINLSIKAGLNEVQLKNNCTSLIHDSLRVEGSGNAKIHDVVEKDIPTFREHSDSPKKLILRKSLKEKQQMKENLEDQKEVIQKRLNGLNKIIGEVGKGVFNTSDGPYVDEKLLEGIEKLFTFYDEQAEQQAKRLREKEQEIKKADEIVTKAMSELNEEEIRGMNGMYSKVVFITLEAEKDTDVELLVTYQVSNANWIPTYDIRVDTSKTIMDITYYGKIAQYTGEDWNNVCPILSTAQTNIGGNIPELGNYIVSLSPMIEKRRKSRLMKGFSNMTRSRNLSQQCEDEMITLGPPPELMNMATACASEVIQNTLSTEFKTNRYTDIPTGTDDHKVTIGIIKLIPKLVHESVPSKNAAAFLTASALNSSEFALLAGQASVFLNNAFVAKTQLKNVSPGERFSCSLGVDTAIRVEYKPAKKYHEEAGYITKHSSNVTEQVIGLKNTRTEQSVLLTIKHHVPRSTDEKIRVKLLSPNTEPYNPNTQSNDSDEHEPVEGSKYNSNHNLEWTVRLNGGESKDLSIKWCVEHPKGQRVYTREQHSQAFDDDDDL